MRFQPGAFAGLAGFADEDDQKRLRAWRVDSTMQWGPGPMRLPKAAKELEKERSGMRFGVRREAVDDAVRQVPWRASFVERWMGGWLR